MKKFLAIIAGLLTGLTITSPVIAARPIRIAQLVCLSGNLSPYAEQSVTGFRMGLEYATRGTFQVLGRPIEVIVKDTRMRPSIGRWLLEEAYNNDRVDLAVGPVSSEVAIPMIGEAEKARKILIIEPAVADALTGKFWNRYIFRTGRNSSQDAIAGAAAIGGPGVKVAYIAQEYPFGRNGVAAAKEALEATGAEVVYEEYLPLDATDFAPTARRVVEAMNNVQGRKYLAIIWAGKNNPVAKLNAMKLDERYGIRLSVPGNIIDVLKSYRTLEGAEGGSYYYYENPNNKINDWLVMEHFRRFHKPPDFFTCGGMVAALAIVHALEKAGTTDTETLIETMEGMRFKTPKGQMVFRKEDHQALQEMYAFRITIRRGIPWGIPTLTRVISYDEMRIPIRNRRD